MSDSSHNGSRSQSLQTNVIRERTDEVEKKYEVLQVLGEGSIGAVSRVRVRPEAIGGSAYNSDHDDSGCFGCCLPKSNGKNRLPISDRNVKVEYAMKSIQLRRISADFVEELRNEVEILRNLDHPNIVKAYETYDSSKQIYMIMELCSGGDLYARSPYSEKESAKHIGKLLSALKHMHDRGIIHRDLKFENIMFENNSPNAEIKLIDFGLSAKFSETNPYLYDGVGTIYTMAPQVLQGVYTKRADLWSVGVITFVLLCGEKPFYHRKRRKVIDKIMRCDYNFNHPGWKSISNEAKEFVTSLIEMDPKKRLSAQEALDHKWQGKAFPLSDRKPSIKTMQDVENNLLTFSNTSELRKLALVMVAHHSSTEEISELRKAFDQYDTANDGIISYDEFEKALEGSSFSDAEVKKAFESLDINNTGTILYTEFLAAALDAQGYIEEERIANAFDRIDSDDTGYISRKNLLDILGQNCPPERVDELIAEADDNKDGKISFDEFLAHCRKNRNERQKEILRLESTNSESTSALVGVDDVEIPGGKFDEKRDEEE
jgi:calcium-dependent protein kinase